MAVGGYEAQQGVSEERAAEGDQAQGFRPIAAGTSGHACFCVCLHVL